MKRHYKISSMHTTNVTDALRCMAIKNSEPYNFMTDALILRICARPFFAEKIMLLAKIGFVLR